MFAEELSSNAARKRQAEARSRRRQLKQKEKEREKRKLEQNKQNIVDSACSALPSPTLEHAPILSESDGNATPNNKSPNEESTRNKTSTKSVLSSSDISSETSSGLKQPTAIERAAQQRRIRQQKKACNDKATKIQAAFRANRSFHKSIQNERQSFDKKMSDFSALLSILKQHQKSPEKSSSPMNPLYIPPPATSTDLTIQLLFFANKETLSREDHNRLNLLIQFVLLPGIQTNDKQMQTIQVWIQTKVGRRRLEKIIRVCLNQLSTYPYKVEKKNHGCATPNQDKYPITFQFLLSLFKIEGDLGNHIHRILYDSNKIGLIFKLRTALMGKEGSLLRIKAAESITKQEKYCMDLIFRLVLDVVLHHGKNDFNLLQIFFKEIFTIPLLTWKIDPNILLQNHNSQYSNSQCPFLSMMSIFMLHYRSFLLNDGYFDNILPKIELNKCPAPPTLCLLANLVQIGRLCNNTNALHSSLFDWKVAPDYFDLLAILLDQVPLGTFTHRAAVEWIRVDSSDTPIILSSLVIDQCRLILLDSWVRALFHFAIDDIRLNTKSIMEKKVEKDLKHENEMLATENAMELAAKEATLQRGEGVLWHGSKWAKKLGKTMNGLFSSYPTKKSPKEYIKGQGQLVNTSSISKEIASGKGNSVPLKTHSLPLGALAKESGDAKRAGKESYNVSFFLSLCRVYGTILSRWGGGGGSDIIHHKGINENKRSKMATSTMEPCALSLLNVLSFSTNIMQTSWGIVQGHKEILQHMSGFTNPERSMSLIRSVQVQSSFRSTNQSQFMGMGPLLLFIFLSTLSHKLLITDDREILNNQLLPKHQLRRCIILLKGILYRACFVDIYMSSMVTKSKKFHLGLSLLSVSSKTMRDLYDRSSRHPLLLPKRWLVDDLLSKELDNCKNHEDYIALLQLPVLQICPYFVPFQRRLILFNHIIATSRVLIQGSNATHDLKPGKMVIISRSRVLEDGLLNLNNLGLRQRLIVNYVNEAGARETGVDAGGLLKEFWCDLSALAFDPNFALFKTTSSELGSYLYPNPSSALAHGSDHVTLFEFLGRILGKALYEGITIQPQFSHFFLSFMRGDYNFMHMLSDLSIMDPVLYNNLMFLKTFEGDASDLCLSFSVANNDFGGNKEIALIPNGECIDVSNANKEKYINLMAKYHVCDRLRVQAEAFTRGLWDVIDAAWLRLFNEPELQVLISGSTSGKLDISDMKAHCKYAGGYTGLDINIHRFWKVVSGMTPKHQAALLKFVTSCERPPASGFKTMAPPFTIQRVGILRDLDKLPSASTCFNVLKLPTYSSEKILKKRLIYAIESGSGFELT